jgi:hypothetical protein
MNDGNSSFDGGLNLNPWGRGAPDPEGWLMKPSIRVAVTVKVDVAAILLRLAAIIVLLT